MNPDLEILGDWKIVIIVLFMDYLLIISLFFFRYGAAHKGTGFLPPSDPKPPTQELKPLLKVVSYSDFLDILCGMLALCIDD